MCCNLGHNPQLTRKIVSDMFYTGELEEMREQRQWLLEWTFKRNDDRDTYLQKIIEEQKWGQIAALPHSHFTTELGCDLMI